MRGYKHYANGIQKEVRRLIRNCISLKYFLQIHYKHVNTPSSKLLPISNLVSMRSIILLEKTCVEILLQQNTNKCVSVSRVLSSKSCGLVFDLGVIYWSDTFLFSNEKNYDLVKTSHKFSIKPQDAQLWIGTSISKVTKF